MLLWLWRRPAASAPIQLLAKELPHAAGVAVKSFFKKENIFRSIYYHCKEASTILSVFIKGGNCQVLLTKKRSKFSKRKPTILLFPHHDVFLYLQTIQILFGLMNFSFGIVLLFAFEKPYPRFPFIFLSGYPFWSSVLVSRVRQVQFEAMPTGILGKS